MVIKEIKIANELPYIATVDKAVFISGTSKSLDKELEEIKKEITNNSSWINGKKMNCLGDSLTECLAENTSKAWHKYIGERNKMTIRNYGISGGTLADNGSGWFPMVNRFEDMDDDADIITVWGGWNDMNQSISMGDMTSRDKTTFYGALHVLYSGLQKKYVGKKIIAIGIHNTIFADSDILERNKAIKEVSSYYSIPFLDLYSNLGINNKIQELKTAYMPDGTHFNTEGSLLLSHVIERFILSH